MLEKISSLEEYILNHIDTESDLLKKLDRDVHVNILRPRMISGHLQGHLLRILCRLVNPKQVLEIGTYTAYATISMAESIAPDAEIHTLEINDELEVFILKYISQAEFKNQIKLHIGDALEIIPTFTQIFDLVFIDADKRLYTEYYDLIFDKVRSGGLIIVDNTLWDGKVLDIPKQNDKQTIGIQKFNDMLAKDERVEKVILPIRDGLTLIWKK